MALIKISSKFIGELFSFGMYRFIFTSADPLKSLKYVVADDSNGISKDNNFMNYAKWWSIFSEATGKKAKERIDYKTELVEHDERRGNPEVSHLQEQIDHNRQVENQNSKVSEVPIEEEKLEPKPIDDVSVKVKVNPFNDKYKLCYKFRTAKRNVNIDEVMCVEYLKPSNKYPEEKSVCLNNIEQIDCI